MRIGSGLTCRRRVSVTASSKLWSWMNAHMYITVFVLTVITDFWANWYSYAIVHDWIVVQAFLGLALPFLNLPSILFFIDQKNMKIRLKLSAKNSRPKQSNHTWTSLKRLASHSSKPVRPACRGLKLQPQRLSTRIPEKQKAVQRRLISLEPQDSLPLLFRPNKSTGNCRHGRAKT